MRIDLHCHTKKVSVFFPRQNKMLLFTPNVIYLGEFLIRKEISLFLTSNSKNFLTIHQFCAAFF